MFEDLVAAVQNYPYPGLAVVFLLCGIGLPLPEEVVLLVAGYLCAAYPDHAQLPLMMAWCAGAILAGDLLPFVLGRVFGVRLLRLRWLRLVINKQRLASFDRWFRRRGDLVIVITRFIPGLRVVAFFVAGTMKMHWGRFLLLDGIGILLIVPLLTWVGFHSAGVIESVIATVLRVERGILWGVLGGAVVIGVWYWLWRRKHRRRPTRLAEAYVQPQRPVLLPPPEPAPEPVQQAAPESPPAGPPAPPDQSPRT